VEIRSLLHCITELSKYRVIRIDVESLKEVLPYLTRILPNVS